ncbi:hypothetical protein C8R43DRAFT_1130267 [Mycena crocata]|nr:hypothetical protein C8R43DRAFT_1130267 [Mycena crocata]
MALKKVGRDYWGIQTQAEAMSISPTLLTQNAEPTQAYVQLQDSFEDEEGRDYGVVYNSVKAMSITHRAVIHSERRTYASIGSAPEFTTLNTIQYYRRCNSVLFNNVAEFGPSLLLDGFKSHTSSNLIPRQLLKQLDHSSNNLNLSLCPSERQTYVCILSGVRFSLQDMLFVL